MVGCFVAFVCLKQAPEVVLGPATGPISTSVRIKPDTYTLGDTTGSGALTVGADGITIDFQGATLQSPDTRLGRLETFNGIGISIQGHKNVTIKNAHIHGFQYNIRVLKSSNVRLENCELGLSRSQRMLSGDSPNQVWLDVRGLDSWRGYGAAVWVEKSSKCTFTGLTANQSQNGLVMVYSRENTVVGCDFSYNSGWGIAIWGSSDNLICWNQADFVNRPWGGGWGGDSAGILFTSGSNTNVLAFNSFTHGGDGFFLAAKNGGFDDQGKLHEEGACNQNQIAFNDGSWSTANAFESTFSVGNIFFHNYCDESNYGFWLGYSNANLLQGNRIKRSRMDGIAHEQGSYNAFVNNDIEDIAGSGIHLWGGAEERFAQSPSSHNKLVGNHVLNAKRGVELKNSTELLAVDNQFKNAPVPDNFKQTAVDQADLPSPYRFVQMDAIHAMRPPGFVMYRDSELPKGWEWLAATAYGMRDYRKMVMPWSMKDARTIRLVLPPKGVNWRINLPEWMEMTTDEKAGEILVTAKGTSSDFGEERPFRFEVTGGLGTSQWIEGTILDFKWNIRWYKWFRTDHDAYSDTSGWELMFSRPGLKEETLRDLPVIQGYRSPEPGLPADHFALVATTNIKFEAGQYRFDTISDDGIQVFVDGTRVINNWSHHGATSDTGLINIDAGIHGIEVRYCQEDGGAALSVHWTKL